MSASAKSGKTSRARIVLIEDNPADASLMEISLRDHGIDYELTLFEDGERAIRAINAGLPEVPDLFLVDLNLPRREGFDVLKTIRATPSLVGVPLAILTSSNLSDDRRRAALLGTEKYIRKPHTLEDFIDKIGRAVADLLASSPRLRSTDDV